MSSELEQFLRGEQRPAPFVPKSDPVAEDLGHQRDVWNWENTWLAGELGRHMDVIDFAGIVASRKAIMVENGSMSDGLEMPVKRYAWVPGDSKTIIESSKRPRIRALDIHRIEWPYGHRLVAIDVAEATGMHALSLCGVASEKPAGGIEFEYYVGHDVGIEAGTENHLHKVFELTGGFMYGDAERRYRHERDLIAHKRPIHDMKSILSYQSMITQMAEQGDFPMPSPLKFSEEEISQGLEDYAAWERALDDRRVAYHRELIQIGETSLSSPLRPTKRMKFVVGEVQNILLNRNANSISLQPLVPWNGHYDRELVMRAMDNFFVEILKKN